MFNGNWDFIIFSAVDFHSLALEVGLSLVHCDSLALECDYLALDCEQVH